MQRRRARRKRVAVPKRIPRFLWVRCGDMDDYNQHDTIDEAADYLKTCGVAIPLRKCQRFGMADSGFFQGENYISIFWGDHDAQPLREINKKETLQLFIQLFAANTAV